MAMIERESSDSFSSHYSDETGDTALTLNAQYGKNVIMFSVNMYNDDYVQSHKEDIEEVLKTFISRLNARLIESNLPSIHVE